MRFGQLVRATAGARGGEEPGTRLGEPRLGGAQQQKQQTEDETGTIHCPSAESHHSCIAATSHPISPPWSFQRGVK